MECALLYKKGGARVGDPVGENPMGGDLAETSEVIEVHHDLTTPIDRQTGRVSGHRVHGALRLLKPIDPATPLLYQALATNDVLKELHLQWFRTKLDGSGEIEKFYETRIFDAQVSKVSAWLPNTKNADLAHLRPCEWVELNYRKIEWEFVEGGILAEDSWERASA